MFKHGSPYNSFRFLDGVPCEPQYNKKKDECTVKQQQQQKQSSYLNNSKFVELFSLSCRSFFELMLFFSREEFVEDPLKDILDSFQVTKVDPLSLSSVFTFTH